jgi:ribosomal-protein-alanine N-acetyltransferase
MSTDLAIRSVQGFDLPVLAALHAACFDNAWDQPWTEKSFAAILAMPGAGGCIAAIGDQPVGFSLARIAADEAELLLLGTHPAWRRVGHARALLAHEFEALAAAGAKQIYLEVAETNVPARNFYRQAGFVQVGLRPRYYHTARGSNASTGGGAEGAIDAIVLARALVADKVHIK